MNKFLISKVKITPTDIAQINLDPSFRKATTNMILAHTACQSVLQSKPDLDRENLACLFATHFGEVSSTLDFLSTYRKTKIASPILFQNGLHNSTLGFVSIQLGIRGPGMTISADTHTVNAVAHAGDSLFYKNNNLLICIVDYIPELLVGNYLKNHPFLENHINQAKAYLFSKDPKPQTSATAYPSLTDFSFNI